MRKPLTRIVLCTLLTVFSPSGLSGNTEHKLDTHYTPSGFFDIHYCNWPDRPPFYLALYSTEYYGSVTSIDIMDTNNNQIGLIDLSRFKRVETNGKPETRVFMSQFPVSGKNNDGWFTAKISLKNDVIHIAKDYVVHQLMPKATGQAPPDKSENIPLPEKLKWDPVEGAAYYKIFIKDMWNDDKLIHTSELLDKPEYKLPERLLSFGGYYSWRIHARDINGHILLGDFNHGSLSSWVEFSVAEE